ncbi:hypothetical protein phiK7A1_131 [Pseudomonas phage phiK7A1]|uniref:Uncharacterized protein n=1 Tax=Pseudomonas phage phiK7A1 TaxID=2759194 RepID=A0A7H0XFX9_9CAUD|nr:hypothetical protein phiK7A1_131 [Pseudomonas phage phiK7A1]
MSRYVRKEFLSPCADETGSIVCQIETPLQKDITEYHTRDGQSWMRGVIKVSDCSKTVHIDFDCHDQSSYEKRIAKLDKMLGEVQAMRNQYEAMWANNLRNIAHKKRQIKQEAIDKAAAEDARRANYRGSV